MIKKITLFVLLISTVSFAQKKKKRWSDDFVATPKPTLPVSEITPFVLENEVLVTYSVSDFNQDQLLDAIVVTAKKDEQAIFIETGEKSKRKVLILQRNSNGVLVKVTENKNVVYCFNCNTTFRNPLVAIEFKKNKFTIEHEAGKANRWTRLTTFQYDQDLDKWFLFRDATSIYKISGSNQIQSIERYQKDFGTILFDEYDYQNIN